MSDGTQDNYGSEGTEVTTTGIPQIPNGAQYGSQGNAPEAVQSPITANTQAPQNPIQPDVTKPVHPQVQPVAQPELPVYKNPYNTEVTPNQSYITTSVQHLTGELGVHEDSFDAVIENALKHNDITLINPTALGKDLTEEQAARVQQLATAAYQETKATVARAQQDVYSIAGSEANWNTAVNAFNANAPAKAQGYAAYLADIGDLKGAAEYVLDYNKQGGYVNQVIQAPEQGGTGTVQSGLTKAEYSAELAKIEQEAGNRSLGSPEFAGRIADLDARRSLGRTQGR